MKIILRLISCRNIGITCMCLILVYSVYFHANITLEYIRAIKWPVFFIVMAVMFKDEISVFATEKLKSFFIKVFGVEFQGNLDDQKSAMKNLEPQDNISKNIVEYKEKELATDDDLNVIYEVKRTLAIREIELDFERIYNRIFGTQFSLLENLIVAGGSNDFLQIEDWYKAIQNNNPVFKDWILATYLNFLFRNSLIENGSNMTINITEKGRSFVQYIRNGMRYSGYKPL